MKDVDYGYLKKTLVDDVSRVQEKKDLTILSSLDDVFLSFESLIKAHPYYANKKVDVCYFLKKNFESYLNEALENNESYNVKSLCNKVGMIFSPRDLGFFERRQEAYALSYAFNNLIEQYSLCKVNL
jgi:hypothetical protein